VTRPPVPPYFFPMIYSMLYASGILIIGMAFPLYRGRVRRNGLYGVRFPATLADDRVWYPINTRGGRDMIVVGGAYLAAVTFTLLFGAHWGILPRILGPTAFLAVGLIVDSIVLWRAASRLAKEMG
jgi:hypothetical protein